MNVSLTSPDKTHELNVLKSLFWHITNNDLRELKTLAWHEHIQFFKRNPHLKSPFIDSLVGICLSQCIVFHQINSEQRINDLDIWHFYKENKNMNFPYRVHKINEDGYKGRRIDFLKRAIPERLFRYSLENPGQIIINYLREEESKTRISLIEKGIIGLWPESIFGRRIGRD